MKSWSRTTAVSSQTIQVSRHVNIYCKIRKIFESTRQTHDDRTICRVNILCGPVHVFCNVKTVRQLHERRKVVSRVSSFWISTTSLLNTSGSCCGRVVIVEKVHVVKKYLYSSGYYILYFVVQTTNVRLSYGVPTTAFVRWLQGNLAGCLTAFLRSICKTVAELTYERLVKSRTFVGQTPHSIYVYCTIIIQLTSTFYDICDFVSNLDLEATDLGHEIVHQQKSYVWCEQVSHIIHALKHMLDGIVVQS